MSHKSPVSLFLICLLILIPLISHTNLLERLSVWFGNTLVSLLLLFPGPGSNVIFSIALSSLLFTNFCMVCFKGSVLGSFLLVNQSS
jgi:hypothetical protein